MTNLYIFAKHCEKYLLSDFCTLAGGTGRDSSELAEGTACRINGKVPVLKGSGDRLTVAVGKSLNIGNMLAHFGGMAGNHGIILLSILVFHIFKKFCNIS